MPKSMNEMDETELQVLIGKLTNTVDRLAYERPNSAEYRTEAVIPEDARQLLTEKRKPKPSGEVTF
jgi:hypothetical protein